MSKGESCGVLTAETASFTNVIVTSSDSANKPIQTVASRLNDGCAPLAQGANLLPPVPMRLTGARPSLGYSKGIGREDTPVPLTDVMIRRAEPREKAYKLTDGRGLFLFVTPKGAKSWRFKYAFGGKERLLTFGLYPEVKLAEARDRTDAARALLRQGLDPNAKVAPSLQFETVAREWFALRKPKWADRHADDVIGSLQNEVFAHIGALPIAAVPRADVASLLKRIEGRGAIETAHRIRQRIAAIFTYGIAMGYCETNPGDAVKGAMAEKPKGKKQPALTDLATARKMLTDALASPAQVVTREATLLLALTAVRPGELRNAEWREIDTSAALWSIPAARMKGDKDRKDGEPHLVPLAPASLAALERLRPLTGHGKLVFPSLRHAHLPLSENAIGYLLNRAGYHGRQTAHGFRATFSSIMNERHPADRHIIDLMLAHLPSGLSGSEGAYNRAAHMPRRVELAAEWARLLTEIL